MKLYLALYISLQSHNCKRNVDKKQTKKVELMQLSLVEVYAGVYLLDCLSHAFAREGVRGNTVMN